MSHTYLSNFHTHLPKFKGDQELHGLSWISKIHAKIMSSDKDNAEEIEKKLSHLLKKLGCHKDVIENRYTEIEDFFHMNWEKMKIYNIEKTKTGAPLEDRMHFFTECVLAALNELYPDGSRVPEDVLHVSCTGYTSPSPMQIFNSKRGYESRVTHLYHMGCYAAIPAIYIAESLVQGKNNNLPSQTCDVFHSELCTLHFNPNLHSPEQLVIQSLFSDGYIRYTVSSDKSDDKIYGKKYIKNSFLIIANHDYLIENTSEMMTWIVSNNSFFMTLSKDIPKIISEYIVNFCEYLLVKSNLGINFHQIKNKIVYALHPGGPKILDGVCSVLALDKNSARHSYEILKKRGNMSSATLPHIWKAILDDNTVEKGSLVLSLAFGPGLTIAGSLFKKV